MARMKVEQGVLWDLDGVLVDTGEFHYRAWSKTLSERDIPFNREQFRATFGMNNAGTLKTLLGYTPEPDVVAEISDRKEELFRRAVKGYACALSGVQAWLKRIKNQGIKQAIASSAPPANIDVLVDELVMRSYFDVLVSGFDLPGKPDPAVFLKAARLIGAPPDRCVVVEDAVAGVEGARRAGMKCIAVTTTNPAHELKEADVVVDRLDNLPLDIFERLLS
ncbi:HAD-IA family hydrolase [Acidobacteria bacterium AH-259-O06]|nr:HAD-IA family hydrolase [Acidobacteria bacterium AH-259-O06]